MTKDMHDGASMSASLHCILVMLQRRIFCAVKLFACVKKLRLKKNMEAQKARVPVLTLIREQKNCRKTEKVWDFKGKNLRSNAGVTEATWKKLSVHLLICMQIYWAKTYRGVKKS